MYILLLTLMSKLRHRAILPAPEVILFSEIFLKFFGGIISKPQIFLCY